MFCTKCGEPLSDTAKFCTKCGQATNLASNNQQYLLTIARAKQWFAVNPPVKIQIDGANVYTVESGKSINIPVNTGIHNVAFSCSIRNKVVEINVTQNMVLNIKFNRFTGSIEVY